MLCGALQHREQSIYSLYSGALLFMQHCPYAKNHIAVQALSLRTSRANIQQKLLPFLQGGSSHHGSANEFKRSRSDSVTSAGSNGSAHRRGVNLDHHSMNAHRRPLEEFLTALRKVRFFAQQTLLTVHSACPADNVGTCML